MADSSKDPNPSAANGEERHCWIGGQDNLFLRLVRKAVAARPEWRQWRAGRKETVAKIRSLFLRYANCKRDRDSDGKRLRYEHDNQPPYKVSHKVEVEFLQVVLAYLGIIVIEGEYTREQETSVEPAVVSSLPIKDVIADLFADADCWDLYGTSESEYLMDTLIWMLVTGCTPNRVREFVEYWGPRDCQGNLFYFEQYYAAKVLTDTLDALDDVEDGEA